jgi:hypothetical protein
MTLRCQKCNEILPSQFELESKDSWFMRNVAPDAASGGTMLPIHHRCAADGEAVSETDT